MSRSPARPPRAQAAQPAPSVALHGRRERRAAEIRERIVRAALSLFAERGMSEVTVEDITEAADVGKGTFFNYFPSKEHVIVALADLQLGKIERLLAEARSSMGSLAETLRRFPSVLAEEPGRSPLLVRSMMAGLVASEPVRSAIRERIQRARQIFAELIALGQSRGEIRRGAEPSDLARFIQNTFLGTMLLWSLEPDDPLGARVERTFSNAWAGLAPAARREARR